MPLVPESTLDFADITSHRTSLWMSPTTESTEKPEIQGIHWYTDYMMVHGPVDHTKTLMNKYPKWAETAETLPVPAAN